MLARSAAFAFLLALTLGPVLLRSATSGHSRQCVPEGRGTVPRHWLGCVGDLGPPRELQAEERLALGLPIDPNTAGEHALARVPGLSRKLARSVLEHRAVHGPFRTVDELLDVKGIGPRRLERARARLVVVAR